MLFRRHRNRLTRNPEQGSVSLETVVVLPVLLTLMFMAMQGALIYQGRTTALAAAQEGARVAAGEYGSASAGIASAQDFVQSSAVGARGSQVSGSRGSTEATVTVTVYSSSVVPGWSPKVTQTASMPVERITG